MILTQIPLNWYITLCSVLFCIGIAGLLYNKNAITLIMSVEIMLNAANLLFAAFSAYNGNANGQVFVFFIMVVAAAEVTVGLSLIVLMHRNLKSIEIDLFNKLKW